MYLFFQLWQDVFLKYFKIESKKERILTVYLTNQVDVIHHKSHNIEYVLKAIEYVLNILNTHKNVF